jgi:hypothetical protein
MMTLFEDVRVFLLQVCRSIGLTGTTATVVPLVVLGVALNLGAMSVVESMRNERHMDRGHTALHSAALTEMKVVKNVVVLALKKIGDGQRRWCPAQQKMIGRTTGIAGYNLEVGFVLAAPGRNRGCDVEIASSPRRKMAIAFVQC